MSPPAAVRKYLVTGATGFIGGHLTRAQRALDLARSSGQTPLADILQKLVDLYKAKTPYHE
jgi:nucleoside-diphosphate-sugar epimerase